MSENTDDTTAKINDLISKTLLRTSKATRSTKRILILSTPRSGSTFFSTTLNEIAHFGIIHEWFNDRYINRYIKLRGIKPKEFNINEYAQLVINKTTSSKGCFGVNIHMEQLTKWKERGVDLLSIGFNLIVFVNRKDKINQAISLATGEKNDVWDGSSSLKIAPTNLSILIALTRIAKQELDYVKEVKHRVKIETTYEELISGDLLYIINKMEKILKLPITANLPKVRSTKTNYPHRDNLRKQLLNYIGIMENTDPGK